MALMNALPLLGEIKQAIEDLLNKGETYTIYSNKLPTTLEDRYFLQDVLGKGNLFMYEKVMHTKTVAFNTLIPGVWIEVVFSERDPNEPILEMVQANYSPPVFTIPKEDMEIALQKLEKDINEMKNLLSEGVNQILKLFKSSLNGEGYSVEDRNLLKELTYYLITDSELTIEDKKSGNKINSTNYYGLWVEYEPSGEPIALHIGDFPQVLKPTKEDLIKALNLIEERKKHFLPKYQNKVDLPLL